MARNLDPPLEPRNGVTLNVLGICRISTVHQDPRSLEDQEALIRQYVTDHYDGPVNFRIVATQGSGEHLDRRELTEIESLIESNTIDLAILEDLARHCRRHHALGFCELCEDSDTRLIAINDNIDTLRDDWRMNAFFCTFKHEASNKDTSLRIRRSLRNRFKNGGIVQFTIYGYIKPPGCTHDSQLQKDPQAEPIYDEMFRRLEEGASYSEIADWLNALGIAAGPFCRSNRWTPSRVRYVVQNPILKGLRVRNRKKSKRNNKTGRHRSVNAPPEELLERPCPHLAFIEPVRYDRVIALLKQRNAKYRRGKNGFDPRKGVPKKRTRWPGQHLVCGICGRPLRYGGHGQKDHLICLGATEYACWNGITADGPTAARTLADAVLGAIEQLSDFDDVFLDLVKAEAERLGDSVGTRLDQLNGQQAKIDREIQNIKASLRMAGPSPSLIGELHDLEAQLDQVRIEQRELNQRPANVAAIPPISELRSRARQAFATLAHDSPEFGRLMRRLIPRLVVRPYQLLDGGHPVLRAHMTLDLVALMPEAMGLEGFSNMLQSELTVDLFDPPQREKYRKAIQALLAEKLTQDQIADRLGIFQTTVCRTVALIRTMQRQNLDDPYIALTEPPTDQSRWRRHLHPRYQFRPLDPNPPL